MQSKLAVVIKVAAKAVGWFLCSLVAVLIVWLIANRSLDASVSPQQKALRTLTDIQVEDTRNVAIGILGLTAPKGTNFIQYGTQIKALYASNVSYAQIQEMMRGPEALRPTIEGNQIACWLDPDWTFYNDCLPFNRAPAVLAENKELLERYKTLYGLGYYAAPGLFYYNDAYLTLVRLAIAEMQIDLRTGNSEAAYRKWRQQFLFVRSNLRGTDTWVGKAIGLVAMGMTLPFLDSLLVADPGLARTHATELYEMLQPDGMAAFDPDGIARAEFQLLVHALDHPPIRNPEFGTDRLHWLAYHFGQRNRILNRYAAFAPEYAAALRLPWSDMEKQSTRLREKQLHFTEWEFALDPFGSLLVAQFIDGQLKAREMLRQMHIVDGRLRLATLLVRLINDNVQDSDIPRFLAAANPKFFDPFTATPARWDPKDRKIFFVAPTDTCTVASWFRVRDVRRAHKSSSSVVDTKAC